MDYAHHHRSFAGPLYASLGAVDAAAVLADPTQTARTRIALTDGVGSDQSHGTIVANQVEGAPKKMGYEIGAAARFLMDLVVSQSTYAGP